VVSKMRKLITEDIQGFLKGKHPEQALQETLRYVQSIIETMRDPLVVLDDSLRVISANQSFYEIFLVRPEDTEGRLIYELDDGRWDIPRLRELLEEILPRNTSFNDFEIDHDFPGIGRRVMLLNGRRIYSEGHKTQRILLGIEDITECKHMEQEVAASEVRYRRLFETAQDGILILGAETAQIEDVNPFLVDMLGFPQQELLGKNLWEIGPVKDIEASRKAFKALQDHEYIRYEDLPLETREGKQIQVEFVSNVYEVNGSKVIQCNIRDVTERKRAEQALQHAQRRIDSKNQIANIFLTVPDDEMYGEVLQVILKAMRSRYGVFGYINELGNLVIPSMTTDIWQKCKVPDKTIVYPPESWGGIWGRALKERKTLYANRDLHVPEGHIPIVRVIVVPILYHKELIGVLEVANRDTDYDEKDKSYLGTLANYIAPILNARLERDKHEKERKRAEQTLRESEEKLHLIIEATSDGIAVTDWDGNLVRVNEAMVRMHGYDAREELIGRSGFELFAVKDRAKAMENMKRALEVGHLGEIGYTLLRKDGSEFDAEIGAAALREAPGTTAGLVVTVRDITERKKLEILKDEFIGMVSHELSSPLTIITGSLNTLLSEGEQLSRDEAHHLLQNATLSADNLSHLLGNLLELSRAQAERLILHDEPIRADIVARNIIDRITEHHSIHKFVVDFPEGLPLINADPLRLERILYNLTDNASKYSPKGTEIRVFAREEKDHLIIGVSDQGVGMPKSGQAMIFKPFERLKPAGFEGAKGAGLGLLVCRRLVEAHGGRIWVESAPGVGSTFFFSLPFNRKP